MGLPRQRARGGRGSRPQKGNEETWFSLSFSEATFFVSLAAPGRAARGSLSLLFSLF